MSQPLANKPWLQSYPEGIPEEIDSDQFASLQDLIEVSCKRYASAASMTCMGTTLTFAEVDQLSRYLAAYLQKRTGLKRGDRVAVMLPNVLQFPVAAFAILRAGMVVVNVNPLYTPRELEHQLNDSGARGIFILENFANTLEKVNLKEPLDTVVTTAIGDLFPGPKRWLTNFVVKRVKRLVPDFRLPNRRAFRNALREGKWQVYDRPDLSGDDLAFLQYTGGTTGVSKGAMLTHRNMVGNVMQATAWVTRHVKPGKDVVMTPLPLYHVFSLTSNLLSFLYLGGRNVLITNPRDLPAFVKDMRRYPFTYISAVNTLFNALLHAEGFKDLDFSKLEVSVGGGMAVQRSVAKEWEEVTGCGITQGYGLTETSPVVTTNPVGIPFSGAVGLPVPSTEVAILGEDGQFLGVNEIGEICVRGPQVMQGYWQRPEETAGTMVEGGWLKTGDVGRVDEAGFVFIEDRKKDMINVSGFNVFPNEIEDVVAHHPGVLEVAAVGVPDDRSGEVVKLFVVKKDAGLTEEDLLAYCREQLTGYKRPHFVEFRDELPKSNVGKVLRRHLRE